MWRRRRGGDGDGEDGPGCIHQGSCIKNGKMVFDAGDPCTVTPPKVKFNMCNDFTAQEISDFQDSYNYIASGNCLLKALTVKVEGKTISVCKGAVNGIALSQPGVITWNPNYAFYMGSLEEELFHHVQFDYYGSSMRRANAEFEAIMYRDIANKSFLGADSLSIDDQTKYKTLIATITNNRTTYPKNITDIIPDTQSETNYFDIMQAFSNVHHFGPADRALKPTTLLEVTNLATCNN